MDYKSVEEANDLLRNGILVQTPKGLVCMSLNDALTSDLNLSVEDLQNVAAQLLLEQEIHKPQKESTLNLVSGDSDGFTSESSDINCVLQSQIKTIKLENNIVEFSTDRESFLSSNVSDSDGSSCFIKVEEKELINDDAVKIPTKKRGGWPKGRKRKPELLHLPPKAPSTGYNLYLNDQRKLFKDSSLPFHEITKLIGNKWSSLSLNDKKPYLEKAEEEKRRYKEELRAYRQSGAYQLYLANKRRKRAKYNVLSESDMDATDDLDDEDNEELYCRTCDQYFHSLHNKREHLQGRQHMQSVAGAINNEICSDYEPDCMGTNSYVSFSTSLDESSMDAASQKDADSDSIADCITKLCNAVAKRENEFTTLQRLVKEKNSNNAALQQQLAQLKERENKLKKELSMLKEKEKYMDSKVFNLWQVPSWFVMNNVNQIQEEFTSNDS